jgi:MerR family copper efflux transcriptional regulator
MDTMMRIAEVAGRSGFSPATLRYYEQVDLLPPPLRTPAGYRAYDETVLSRLAFIARAKRLGCSLEEVAGLMPAWDEGHCPPVQDGLRALASVKLAEARARAAELGAFAVDLERILDTLGRHTPDGPCDADCGCVGDPSPVVACTLAPAELPGRLQDWHDLATHVASREPVEGGLRLLLDATTPLDRLAVLMQAEQGCCAFFAFALTVDGRGAALEVRAPAEGMAMVDALFG